MQKGDRILLEETAPGHWTLTKIAVVRRGTSELKRVDSALRPCGHL